MGGGGADGGGELVRGAEAGGCEGEAGGAEAGAGAGNYIPHRYRVTVRPHMFGVMFWYV